jgi:pimeloyl-ACP methyl ester carboxylesterase
MATYVLIHNGFAGGWVWQKVAGFLKEKRHHVFAPTLTGLAERSHLATPQTDLNVHINDILELINSENIKDVILVASSWGGMVATGVVNRCCDRISKLVYLDTLIPEHGQSWLDLLPHQFAAHLQKIVDKDGDGWRIPVYRDDAPKWTDHPFKSVTQSVVLDNSLASKIPRTFIHCTDKPEDYHFGMTPEIAMHAARAQKNGWEYYELETSHLAMLHKPKELSEIMMDLD